MWKDGAVLSSGLRYTHNEAIGQDYDSFLRKTKHGRTNQWRKIAAVRLPCCMKDSLADPRVRLLQTITEAPCVT